MTFQKSDVEYTSGCCGKSIVGIVNYPSFQDRKEEVKERESFKRVVMLVNPTSGGGRGGEMCKLIVRQLEAAKIGYKIIKSTSVMHFYDVVESFDFSNHNDLFMVCGGDGSIFMALNILSKRQAVERKLKDAARDHSPVLPF